MWQLGFKLTFVLDVCSRTLMNFHETTFKVCLRCSFEIDDGDVQKVLDVVHVQGVVERDKVGVRADAPEGDSQALSRVLFVDAIA